LIIRFVVRSEKNLFRHKITVTSELPFGDRLSNSK